jgi:hypothetical protein
MSRIRGPGSIAKCHGSITLVPRNFLGTVPSLRFMCSGKALEDMNLDELDELEDEEEEKILLQMRFVFLLKSYFYSVSDSDS